MQRVTPAAQCNDADMKHKARAGRRILTRAKHRCGAPLRQIRLGLHDLTVCIASGIASQVGKEQRLCQEWVHSGKMGLTGWHCKQDAQRDGLRLRYCTCCRRL